MGGYVLGGKPFDDSIAAAVPNVLAGEWIRHIMAIADVEDWSKLKGRAVRVKHKEDSWSGPIIAIGHIINDQWFCPKEASEAALPTPPNQSEGDA